MSWTDENNMNEAENDKVALGLKDVENELKKNNQLVNSLRKEQKEYSEKLTQEHQTILNQEIKTLRNQKTEDLEDLAFKFNQKVQKQGKEWTNHYLKSAQKTVQDNFSEKEQALNALNQDIWSALRRLKGINNRLDTVEANQKTTKQKEILQESMLVLGAIIASIGTGLLIWAVVSVLYSFGFHSIWEWKAATPAKDAPTLQQAFSVIFKGLLSIGFFLLGLVVMFTPLGIYHAFLKSIEYKYNGIKGWLNKIFLRKEK